MSVVTLDGNSLTPHDVLAVARGGARVELTPQAERNIQRSRAVVDRLLDSGVTVYGLNTGFGSLRDIHITPAQARELQVNLIRSHCCGVGDPAPADVVRAMMLLRANTLAKGHSGVRLVVVRALLDMLNARIHPRVPVKGSVGASGDLAPLSHLALALMGEGQAYLASGELAGADAALRSAGLVPLILEAKEGLALNNGTQFMTAVGVLALLDALHLADVSVQTCALSLEAMQGVRRAFDDRIHTARGQRGQARVAKRLIDALEGSELLATPINFGALNGACDSLEQALSQLRERAVPRRPDSAELDAGDSVATIDLVLRRLKGKREALAGQIDTTPVAGATEEREEDHRASVARTFEEDIEAVERVYDRVFSPAPRHTLVGARKHLQHALGRLQEVIPDTIPVQDDYCLRCAPQVIGAAIDGLDHALAVVTRELNAATDNPLIFPPDLPHPNHEAYREALTLADCRHAVVSGGNFHGAPIALVMDQSCPAVASIGNISERRTFHLTTGRLSNGLPRFLTPYAGLHSGLMIAQVTAASLVSENKTLCHPASADSIPTVEDAEDHVSMGAFAARKFADIVNNVRLVVAVEMICAARGIKFRNPARPSHANVEFLNVLARYSQGITEGGDDPADFADQPVGPAIESVAAAIRDRHFEPTVAFSGQPGSESVLRDPSRT